MSAVMVDMELDDEQKMDAPQPIPMKDRPDYPYGLRICLCSDELDKLDLDPSDAVVGGIIYGHFLGKITSVSASAGESYSDCRVEIQITALSIDCDDDQENDDSE